MKKETRFFGGSLGRWGDLKLPEGSSFKMKLNWSIGLSLLKDAHGTDVEETSLTARTPKKVIVVLQTLQEASKPPSPLCWLQFRRNSLKPTVSAYLSQSSCRMKPFLESCVLGRRGRSHGFCR